MRTASAALLSYFAISDAIDVADLLTITLANGGAVVRLTTYDEDLIVDGNVYNAGPTLYRRDLVKVAVGLVADPIKLTIFPGAGDLLGGVSWQAAALRGLFDGARISVDKVFMAEPGDTRLGGVNLFSGRVADIDGDRTKLELTCKSDVELLDAPFPRNVYQPNCANTLFDSVCTLNRVTFTTATAAQTGSTAKILNDTGLSQPTGYYDLGTVTMTSGALLGMQRPIKAYVLGSPNTIELMRPFPAAPAAGDTMDVAPGCDKLQTTCTTKFSNLAHFRGEPFVPAPEEAS